MKNGTEDNAFDVIVIGSGMGGMAAAAALSKAGHKVLLLEQYETLGGLSHSFSIEGFSWDAGIHYLNCVAPEDRERHILDWLSDTPIELASMGAIYDNLHIGDAAPLALSRPYEAQARDLKDRFPDEAEAIDAWIAALKEGREAILKVTMTRAMPEIIGSALKWWHSRAIERWCMRTTQEVIDAITGNPDLAAAEFETLIEDFAESRRAGDGWMGLAEAYTDAGDVEAAVEAIEAVERLDSGDAFGPGTSWRETRTMFGRQATEEEVADSLGLQIDKFHDLLNQVRGISLVNLEEIRGTNSDGDRAGTFADIIEDVTAENPFASLKTVETKHVIGDTIGSLPEKERLVVSLYYYEDLTMREIGATLSLSESRVCQLHSRIISRLRQQLEKHQAELLS